MSDSHEHSMPPNVPFVGLEATERLNPQDRESDRWLQNEAAGDPEVLRWLLVRETLFERRANKKIDDSDFKIALDWVVDHIRLLRDEHDLPPRP